MALEEDHLDELAHDTVYEFLMEGLEYITYSEVLADNAEDEDEYNDYDVARLADKVRERLNELAGYL